MILSLQLGVGGLSAYASHNRWLKSILGMLMMMYILSQEDTYIQSCLQILSQPCPGLLLDNVRPLCLGSSLHCTCFHTLGHGGWHYRKNVSSNHDDLGWLVGVIIV